MLPLQLLRPARPLSLFPFLPPTPTAANALSLCMFDLSTWGDSALQQEEHRFCDCHEYVPLFPVFSKFLVSLAWVAGHLGTLIG